MMTARFTSFGLLSSLVVATLMSSSLAQAYSVQCDGLASQGLSYLQVKGHLHPRSFIDVRVNEKIADHLPAFRPVSDISFLIHDVQILDHGILAEGIAQDIFFAGGGQMQMSFFVPHEGPDSEMWVIIDATYERSVDTINLNCQHLDEDAAYELLTTLKGVGLHKEAPSKVHDFSGRSGPFALN